MNAFSERRLKENEVIFREANETVQQFIEEETGHSGNVVPFYCECSRADCRQRIELTTGQYDDLHQNKKQFIVLAGHEIPEIEKIVFKQAGFNVVEKYGKVPSPQEINTALTTIKV